VPRDERRRDIESAVAEVRRRGGALIRWGEDDQTDHVFAVMADPEGNEFCLV
jgi:predicted enzyme related to lactoylglutathione lyase